MASKVTLTGSVVKKIIADGSPNGREAVVLVVDSDRKEYVLRQQGSNPFTDPVLETMVGKRIHCDGRILGYHFIFTDWEDAV